MSWWKPFVKGVCIGIFLLCIGSDPAQARTWIALVVLNVAFNL